MGKSLRFLMDEVDGIIEKRATEEPVMTSSYDNDINKIAEDLIDHGHAPVSHVSDDFSFVEKLAHSLAMAEAYINMPYLKALASFEKKAFDAGYTPEQIEEQLIKTGAVDRYVPLSQVMDMNAKRKKRK